MFSLTVTAQTLVTGGQFKDRILPMHGQVTIADKRTDNPSARTWGAPGVQNRYLDNGVERDDMNIWGGNVYKDAQGLYHQFVAGWDGMKRPFSYWSNSHIYHFTSSTPYGPFTNPVDIGAGHNPEIYVAKDGTYVVYALIGNSAAWRHVSSFLNGPWTFERMPCSLRDRTLSTGSTTTYSNWTFARRQDGSVYCMDRGGAVWISENGLSEFGQVLSQSCYPNGGGGTFEDPVVWRDEVQYHMIVNDWKARKAYYSRSADGFHWVAEDGLAYDIDISVHPDGTKEEWYKYERPRVFQDEYGRAIQLNMAVVDTIKAQDQANDNHSSKNIAMPLNPGLRMSVQNDAPVSAATAEIRVRIMSEEGFNPARHLDLSTLRFGRYTVVNRGGGAVVKSSTVDSDGSLVLTLDGKDTGLTSDDFAPKLIGRYAAGYVSPSTPTASAGGLCYGYAKLPYYNYTPAYLSPVLPQIGSGSRVVRVRVDNVGLSSSEAGTVLKVLDNSGSVLATGTVPSVAPYANATVELSAVKAIPAGSTMLTVALYKDGRQTDSHKLLLTDINAKQAKLSGLYNDARILYDNDEYRNEREMMGAAISCVKPSVSSFFDEELDSAIERITAAIAMFRTANPDVANVSCRNYYVKAANLSAGNIYMYVAADGTLARKSGYDSRSVFTLVTDGDAGRVYLYNPSSKTFIVAKAGNGSSFWSASSSTAYCLADVEPSSTTGGAFVIKGDATSTSAYNYLNAYGGQNHTELCSYTKDNSGSQWTLVACPNQTYTFDVTEVKTGREAFVESAAKIKGAVILPEGTDVHTVAPTSDNDDTAWYSLKGVRVDNPTHGVYVKAHSKRLVK